MWRYSRVADLDLEAFTPATPAPRPLPAALPDPVGALLAHAAPCATVWVVDGTVARVDLDGAAAAAGLVVAPIGSGDEPPPGADEALGSCGAPVDVFAVLNDAFTSDPVLVRIPAGATLPGPVVVVHWSERPGTAVFPRLVVQAGADSDATVLSIQASPAGLDAFVAPVVELQVARAARLGFTDVQVHGLSTWQIASTLAQVEADATLRAASAGLGGDYARHRTDCRMAGRGATGELLAVYFGEGTQTLDFRTFQDHAAPDTTSNLLFKGAVGGHSRSVYTGLIRVRKNARGTNAFQTNRNIKLSDGAWAESVPNLEIENNDVRCSHASAVGPIDEDQRFYLESRGVPTPMAEQLVVLGFFDEVLAQAPGVSIAGPLRAEIAGKLARRFGP